MELLTDEEIKKCTRMMYTNVYKIVEAKTAYADEAHMLTQDILQDTWIKYTINESKYSDRDKNHLINTIVKMAFYTACDELRRRSRYTRVSFETIMSGIYGDLFIDTYAIKMDQLSRFTGSVHCIVSAEELFEEMLACFPDSRERAITRIELRSSAENREEKYDLYNLKYKNNLGPISRSYFYKLLPLVRSKAEKYVLTLLQEKGI
ncbi:hypothetical protein [Roseivirga misakiensis]|uniref:Uncharacterized protein n=1 Tax=Roseivirga misakiensis TaxID=1563681 RepID=A0A1E5T329_9BACT|nr:hypothetical protein [Roseivirga misakiensis]OEK05780.1 hypothetical protein BFP71_06580 [Roseivirga misakiensis]